jgi:hypothetical protein
MSFREYLVAIVTGLSILANALIGGEAGDTLSARIGRSILRGGLASRIPMPEAWREHFERAADRV